MPSHEHHLDAICGGIRFELGARLKVNTAEPLGVGRYQPPRSYISINGRDSSRELARSCLAIAVGALGSQASRDLLPTTLIISLHSIIAELERLRRLLKPFESPN
jgi:hypothetical protein